MTAPLRGVCPLLQVFDMPAALAFYRDVLGMRVIGAALAGAPDDTYGWVWLQADGAGPETQLMLNTAYDPDAKRPAVPDPARVAAHGDTIVYFRLLRLSGRGCPLPAPAGLRRRGDPADADELRHVQRELPGPRRLRADLPLADHRAGAGRAAGARELTGSDRSGRLRRPWVGGGNISPQGGRGPVARARCGRPRRPADDGRPSTGA